MSKRRSGWGLLVLLLLFAFAVSACSSSKKADSTDVSGAHAPMSAEAQPAEQGKVTTTDGAKVTFSEAAAQADAVSAPAQDKSTQNAAGSSGFGQIADESIMNRKVIYKANVTMRVPHFDPAEQQLRDAIHLSGSYLLQFSNTIDTSGKGATYVIKVPADGFSSFIEKLRKIEKDLQLQMEGNDVTEEYVDLNARLQAKKTVESRLLAFMDKATKTDDLVRFSNELAAVQEQIEQFKGRMRYLDQNVAYSTVNVRLYEGAAEAVVQQEKEKGFGVKMVDTMNGSAKLLGEFGKALLLFLAALLPVLAVAALIGIPVWLILRERRRSRRPG